MPSASYTLGDHHTPDSAMDDSDVRETTRRCKSLSMTSLLLLIFVSLALAVWWIPPFESFSDLSPRVCEEEACNATARRLFNSLDLTASPCDNFYQFVCGGYIRHAEIPEGKQKISPTLEMEEKVLTDLKGVLENITSVFDSPPKPYSAMAELYSLCLDLEDMEKDGVAMARKVFQEAGGWPMMDKTTLPANWTFLDTVNRLSGLTSAANSLIKISVNSNSSGVYFLVQPPELGLPARELSQGLRSPKVTQYRQHMVDTVVLFGLTREGAEAAMRPVQDLESAVAELISSKTDNSFSSEYTLQNLQELPSLNWLSWAPLLRSLVPTSQDLSGDQPVTVLNPEYIMKLGDLLSKKQSSVVADYIFWRAAEELAPLVSEQMRRRQELRKGAASQPRWLFCLRTVSDTMGVAMSSLYVSRYLGKRVKGSADILVENIRQELIDNIQESALDGQSKSMTMEQARNIRTVVAYPDGIVDLPILESYYKDLNPNKEHFLLAMMDVKRWQHDVSINMSVQGVGEGSWGDLGDLTVPKATFDTSHRTITVNAGLLQPPLFSPAHPLYINYGTIGYLVAHHFAHVLDHQPSHTTSEHVAYKDGLKVAYRAYKRAADQLAEPEVLLPGLQQYTPGQLFMMGMGNMLCVKQRSAEAVANDGTTEGSAHKTSLEKKINGLVKHFADFKQLFRCDN